ncbi:MAG TPA: TraR/DksA C4-type zinc finger protein [Alkalispirochaeta sp.]|nr:TraR/DksA C4-type zinc finger protein [Alkalispirochaeta sp.]
MTDQERHDQKALIEARITDIESSFDYLAEETKAVEPSVALGRLTRMEALNDKGVNEHVLAQSRQTLERLKNALTRIADGTYGVCVRCGKEIPLPRLQHVPEALICVPCSEKKAPRR